MAFTTPELADINSSMTEFMETRRPPVEIRDQVDLDYRIESQSVVIFSTRPVCGDKSRKIEEPAAKATYNRKSKRWKIYWQRADQKWHAYPPHPEAILFDEFLAIVDEDKNCCFWG